LLLLSTANFTRFDINFYYDFLSHGACQRFALPALGRAAGRRPTGKMKRRRKLLGIAAESPASGARFVGKSRGEQDTPPKNRTQPFTDLIVHAPQFFTSLTLPLKPRQNWKNAKAEDLLKPLLKTDFAKTEPCQKKTRLTKKPKPNLPKPLLKN
jgi:hypothetical protein